MASVPELLTAFSRNIVCFSLLIFNWSAKKHAQLVCGFQQFELECLPFVRKLDYLGNKQINECPNKQHQAQKRNSDGKTLSDFPFFPAICMLDKERNLSVRQNLKESKAVFQSKAKHQPIPRTEGFPYWKLSCSGQVFLVFRVWTSSVFFNGYVFCM